MKNKYRFELAKLLRRGEILRIKPSMKCNLKCPYCSVNKAHGRAPKFKDRGWEEWAFMGVMNKYKMITISGGEPGLYPGIAELIQEFIDLGHLVQVISNLTTIGEFMKVKSSWRLVFLSTYHPVFSEVIYHENYLQLSEKFYVTMRELKYFPHASVKGISTDQDDTPMKIYSPDGRLHESCQALDRAGK